MRPDGGRFAGGGSGLPERHLQLAGESHCQEIDQQVQAFLSRPLESSSYACVYLDATYLKGRLGKAQQVCSRAVVVAMGVNEDGRRELLGLKVGDSETETFWAEFITSLKERGLAGLRLVVSDAHSGLTWQR
jgi:putative transposase